MLTKMKENLAVMVLSTAATCALRESRVLCGDMWCSTARREVDGRLGSWTLAAGDLEGNTETGIP
jgi:hypothetical protein